jgi:hypothetical protein
MSSDPSPCLGKSPAAMPGFLVVRSKLGRVPDHVGMKPLEQDRHIVFAELIRRGGQHDQRDVGRVRSAVAVRRVRILDRLRPCPSLHSSWRIRAGESVVI